MEANIRAIFQELARAKKKWNNKWPADPVHAAAILHEEAGELTQAALDFCYSNGHKEQMRKEAIQCGAMALWFLAEIDNYQRTTGYANGKKD